MCPFKKNSVTHQLQFVLSVFFWSMVEPIKTYTLKENWLSFHSFSVRVGDSRTLPTADSKIGWLVLEQVVYRQYGCCELPCLEILSSPYSFAQSSLTCVWLLQTPHPISMAVLSLVQGMWYRCPIHSWVFYSHLVSSLGLIVIPAGTTVHYTRNLSDKICYDKGCTNEAPGHWPGELSH